MFTVCLPLHYTETASWTPRQTVQIPVYRETGQSSGLLKAHFSLKLSGVTNMNVWNISTTQSEIRDKASPRSRFQMFMPHDM